MSYTLFKQFSQNNGPDGKLSDSSGRAKRGGRFWVELDKSENLDSILALLLLCAVH